MHIRLIAVGARQPAWLDDAVAGYTARLPSNWQFRIDTIATVRRTRNTSARAAAQGESQQILARTRSDETVVLLDETGRQLNSNELAAQLSTWQAAGRDLSFVIGGPDGVANDCFARADFTWSLSKLTLPHGIARLLLIEQLYRAWSLQSGHPYHRD